MHKTGKYGLNPRDMQTITGILRKYAGIKKAVLFGSRAKGAYHSGSDIDIAIVDGNIDYQTLIKIKNDMEDSSLPYNADVVNFSTLSNSALKEHILRTGKVLFRQNEKI
ncbi:MAG: nucleotidyltransferase domain-containing protein [Bacteroidales bacterium]|jgi:predicted nucleotidyltransferase|nr:nucleotidyltransferase domain-containing protein [Bacteroidales bacterium]